MWILQQKISNKTFFLKLYGLAFPATCIILALLSFAKGVILGACLALSGAKYNRPSGEENKNQNNLKVTVLKQVSKNLLHDKFSENRFFLSCRTT